MSRCFPFPPPGYAGNCANNDALILSIKLQREREEKRKERKVKKEKKRDKKEKVKSNAVSDGTKEAVRYHHPCNGDKHWLEPPKQFSKYKQGCKSDSLDKSTVTEEHRLPCNSSDSTENSGKKTESSSKRKSHPIPSQSHGNIIRIRLSSKRNESTITCVKEQPCSTSGRTDAAVVQGLQAGRSALCRSTSLTSSSPLLVPARQTKEEMQAPLTLRTERKVLVPQDSATNVHRMQKEELLYRNLVENWLPPPIDNELDGVDDQAWLFETKRGDDRAAKRLRSCLNDAPSCGFVELQPQARYLADVGICALPFSVPF